MDYSASQYSVESLGTKLGIHKNEEGDKDKDKDRPTRRSDRNLDKKDAKIEDLAKERAAEKDNYGKDSTLFDEKNSLYDMASKVGIDLGCALDMVAQNLDLISNMEQARRDIYLQNSINKNREEKKDDSPSLIDIEDVELEDLYSEGDNTEDDIEKDHYDKLKKIFSSNRKMRGGMPAFGAGEKSILSGGNRMRHNKRKKMRIKQKEKKPPLLDQTAQLIASQPARPASFPCSPDPGRNRGALPPDHLAGTDAGEDKAATPPPPRSRLPLAPTLALVPAPLPLPSRSTSAAPHRAPPSPWLRHSRGHRPPRASPARPRDAPSSATPSAPTGARREPPPRARRPLLPPAAVFVSSADSPPLVLPEPANAHLQAHGEQPHRLPLSSASPRSRSRRFCRTRTPHRR